jgi:nucleotide-binding universal stress UspA family protein
MAAVPRSVLVAVDFGDASARAVALGGVVADGCGAVLHLLHADVGEAPVYFTSEQVEYFKRQQQLARALVEQSLVRFGRNNTGRPFASVVEARSPVDAILHEGRAADFVVMGTHGRSGPKRWWLGSVAERVLHDIDKPLLVVRSDTTQDATSLFERVLVHAAAPLTGTSTLEYARRLTACFKGDVVDGRHGLVEPAVASGGATILIVATPQPRTGGWLATYGDPLLRDCKVPVLFVPEVIEGVVS